MEKTEVRALGYVMNKDLPGSNEEIDELAKRANAAFDFAIAKITLHIIGPSFRAAFSDLLETATGFDRLTNETEDESVSYAETETQHHKRLLAHLAENGGQVRGRDIPAGSSEESIRSALLPIAQEAMDSVEVDLTQREPKGPKPTGLKTAAKLLDTVLERGATLEKVAALYTGKLGREVVAERDAVVVAIAEVKKREADEARKREEAELASVLDA